DGQHLFAGPRAKVDPVGAAIRVHIDVAGAAAGIRQTDAKAVSSTRAKQLDVGGTRRVPEVLRGDLERARRSRYPDADGGGGSSQNGQAIHDISGCVRHLQS